MGSATVVRISQRIVTSFGLDLNFMCVAHYHVIKRKTMSLSFKICPFFLLSKKSVKVTLACCFIHCVMEECNILFLHLPHIRERRENVYEFFLPCLVSTTCKLTPFQMQLESVLYGLYQKQPSRGVLRKMCSENMHAANFIYRRTPMLNTPHR